MISIVICSVNSFFARQVKENIDSTIGVEWEPIIIDNTHEPKSITQVYNAGASIARHNLICFVHEDVLFQSQNWGQKIIEYFSNDKNLGLVGVAGSKYKSKTVSGWYTGVPELDCGNIWHLNQSQRVEKIYFNPQPGSKVQDVVSLDGVFLASKKSVWKEIGFDEKMLRDFHLYDLDYSIRVAEKYKVIVSFEIDILHIVKGMHFGDRWLEYTLQWHKENADRLPASLSGLTLKHESLERIIRKTWLIRLKHESINIYNKLKWLGAIRIWKHISEWPYTFLFLFKRHAKKSQIANVMKGS